MTTPNESQRPRRAAHFSTPATDKPTTGSAQGSPSSAKRAAGHIRVQAVPQQAVPQQQAGYQQQAASQQAVPQQQAVAQQGAQAPVAAPVGSARGNSALTTNRMSGAAARATRRAGNHNVRREQTKKRGGAGLIVGGAIAAVIVVLAFVLVIVPAITSSTSDTQSIQTGQTVTVTIPDGAGASAVAQALYDAKAIANKSEFLTQVSRLKADSLLKSGTYSIVVGNDLTTLINQLEEGPNAGGITVTVPEGYTVKRIAAAVEQALGISSDEFIAQAKAGNYKSEYSFLDGVSDDASLEGFLFPKTYSFSEGATADGVIRTMLSQFQTELATLDLSYPQSRGLSVAEMVNLASIVEKESTQSTGAQVAAVFYNRLGNFGDPNYGYLQSDATTAYTVGHDPTAEEVHDSSDPYSTYTHQGLPPTPICCPGLKALQAVCSPDTTALEEGDFYFYFWNDADGNVQYKFSKTYEEHQQAIRDAQQ